MDEALLCISQAGRGQLVNVLITLEQNGIFGSNFANLIETEGKQLYLVTIVTQKAFRGREFDPGPVPYFRGD